jgi:hypothetical protein
MFLGRALPTGAVWSDISTLLLEVVGIPRGLDVDKGGKSGQKEWVERMGRKGKRSICKLVELLVMTPAVIFCSGEFGQKEHVDKGGLLQTQSL